MAPNKRNNTARRLKILKRIIIVGFWTFLTFSSLKFYTKLVKEPKLPDYDLDRYWGQGAKKSPEIAIHRLVFSLEDSVVKKLKSQLNLSTAILPEPLEDVNFEYGMNSNTLKDIIQYWGSDYIDKWYSEREFHIGKYPLYETKIQGLNIAYNHIYPKNIPNNIKIIPLLLLHGWPGSPLEFYDAVPKLTTIQDGNDFVFEVIIPYLPGFGLSEAPHKQGFDPTQAAILLNNLMKRLNIQKYYIQGGDFGHIIGSAMATIFPNNVLGFHSNFCIVSTALSHIQRIISSIYPDLFIEKGFSSLYYPLSRSFWIVLQETGYFHIQATKPDTIGAVLTNNPIGLAAYLLEKYSTWTSIENINKVDGGLKEKFTLDELLDIITMYYATNSIGTSVRFYKESLMGNTDIQKVKTNVPFGCARFTNDLRYDPDWILKGKFSNIVQSSYYTDGGHFAAMEEPDLFAQDVIKFVDKVEKITASNKNKNEL